MRAPTSVAVVLAAAVLFGAAQASNAVVVPNCQYTCTTDCELGSDIYCANGEGLALSNGADLDLKGHRLICEDPSNENECGGPAVTIVPGSTGSVVKDTGTPKGAIVGLFFRIVSCFSQPGSSVNGIVVDGADSTAMTACAQVENNVIIGAAETNYPGDPAIVTGGVGTTGDFIRNNTITQYAKGINLTGSKPVSITGNVIVPRFVVDGNVSSAIALSANTSTSTKVEHNSIVGHVGVPITGNATAQFTNNHCDVENPDCDACIASHYCWNPEIGYCTAPSLVMKPAANAQVQFAYRQPSVAANHRYLLLADFPEANADGAPTSYIANTSAGTRTDLFYTLPVDPGGPVFTFARCTLRAHMTGSGATSTATYLVIKDGATQSDGSQINVPATSYPIEYIRVMTHNPVTNLLWTADTAPGVLIGVKNNNDGSGGVAVADLQLDCE